MVRLHDLPRPFQHESAEDQAGERGVPQVRAAAGVGLPASLPKEALCVCHANHASEAVRQQTMGGGFPLAMVERWFAGDCRGYEHDILRQADAELCSACFACFAPFC
jgi:hypothetical protein